MSLYTSILLFLELPKVFALSYEDLTDNLSPPFQMMVQAASLYLPRIPLKNFCSIQAKFTYLMRWNITTWWIQHALKSLILWTWARNSFTRFQVEHWILSLAQQYDLNCLPLFISICPETYPKGVENHMVPPPTIHSPSNFTLALCSILCNLKSLTHAPHSIFSSSSRRRLLLHK